MKKKILFLLSFLFIALSAWLLVPNMRVYADSVPREISLTARNFKNGYAYPNDVGATYYTVSVDIAHSEDIYVYYETRDKSAVSELGDYLGKSSVAIIPKNEKSTTFVVYTARSEFAVQSPEGVIYSREYEVCITDVKGISNYVLLNDSISGMILYNYVYTAREFFTIQKRSLYFKEYETIDISPALSTPEIDGEGEESVRYDFSASALYSHWKKNYINKGLANLYAMYEGVIDDWGLYTYWSYAELYDSDDNILIGLKSEGYYDDEILNPNCYGHDDFGWYDKIYSDTTFENHYHDKVCCVCKKDLFNNINFHSFFAKVKGEPNYTLKYRTEGGRDREIHDVHIYSTLIDDKAPTVEGGNFYASSLKRTGDKLRVAIRFSEPVYYLSDDAIGLSGDEVEILVYPNGDKNYPVTLSYAGGSYTDTLYYETDYDKVNYPHEKISYFTLGENTKYPIYDFAYRKTTTSFTTVLVTNNQLNNLSGQVINKASVEADLREPELSFSCDTKEEISKQHTVTVSVSNVDLDGSSFYYSWEDTSESLGEVIKDRYYYGTAQEVNTIMGGGHNEKKYLHVYVETKYNRSTYKVYDTALSFDNQGPSVEVDSTVGNHKSRTFEVTVKEEATVANSGLKELFLYYKKENDTDYTIISIKTFNKNVYESTISYELKASDIGLVDNTYSYVDIGFYATDRLGNRSITDLDANTTEYLFNSGNSFVSKFDSIDGSDNHELLHFYNNDTLIINKEAGVDLTITFKNEDYIETFATLSPQIDVVYDVFNEKYLTVPYENPVSDPTSIEVSLNPYDGFGLFVAGYYKIRFYVESLGEKFYSRYYHIYLSENGEYEFTPNYLELDNQNVLNNFVYQLSTKYPNYYYLDVTGSLQVEPYATINTAATFSSYDKAYQYVYYRELLDLYGKRITALEANYLNGGSIGTHRKAENEDTVAQEGQIWIRYKRTKWDYIDQESSWVWYCYDDSTNNPEDVIIDTTIGVLPDLLVEALTTVTKKITGNGQYLFLVGKDYTDKYGAPKLNSNQMHVNSEYFGFSNCLTQFAFDIVYPGDPNILKSEINYNDNSYPLVTNYTLVKENNVLMFYRVAYSNDEYKKLNFETGATYGEAINANGLFEILEAGPSGVKNYYVFIDRQAPIIEVSYVDSYGNHKTTTLTQENSGTYINAQSVTLEQMVMEVDDLAYILLYKSSNLELLDVITLEELNNEPYELTSDHYTAHIYDRSGNFYVVNIRTNDSPLECKIREQENEFIVIETNRSPNQVQYFEVYLDGELLTNVYTTSYKSTKSGSYQVNIKDWYGNVESIEYDFELELPTVEWKYEIDGQLYNYTEDCEGMKLRKLGENEYFILSKGLLQFTLKSGYDYTFIGSTPDYSHSYINNRVKIKESVPFTLEIYYANNPRVYVSYNVSFDETPPDIYASFIEREYAYEELQEFMDNIKDYGEGAILIPSSLDVNINSSSFSRISNGQEFESDFINVEFNDSSGVYDVKIYLDDELIKELVYGDEMDRITLSRKGEYRIVATDILGNVNELNFTNKNITSHSLSIDGNNQTSNDSYLYGNQSIDVSLSHDGEVAYLIKTKDDVYFVSLIIKNGVIYESYYYVGKDQNLNSTIYVNDSTVLFKISEETKPNVAYDLTSRGMNFTVMYDTDNNFHIKTVPVDDKIYDFECRIDSDDDIPMVYQGGISNMTSDVVLKDYQGNVIETNKEGKYIYLSKEFSVDSSHISNYIEYIKVNHSTGDANEIYQYVYQDGVFNDIKFVEDGFYDIEIKNVFGNITTYKLAMSNTFITTSSAFDNGGNETSYSKDYTKKIYSNSSVVITAYSEEITCEVIKDGKPFKPQIEVVDGITVITLNMQGNYIVNLIDQYGNTKTISSEIKYFNLTFDEDLLYGYSSGAKKNYTNQKLSINHSLFDLYGIVYTSVIYQDEEHIIYDLINENTVEYLEDAFIKCVGFDDTQGTYKVIFKDKYGNQISKTIYYSDLPTIELSRTTRSNEVSKYNIDDILEGGIWSNNSIYFTSTSKEYEFKINGETCYLPYTLLFDTDTLESDIKYEVYYSDEYGYAYSFNAYLHRKDVEIKVLNEDVVLQGSLDTVKSNIQISVEDDIFVTYTIDNSKEFVFNGEDLFIDGIYRIEATDKAGNKNAITIRKDTFAYYEFYNVGKNQSIINGEVVNSDTVNFNVKNSDTTYIDKVFLNGALLEDYDKTTFSENGKWEFILCDEMGNKSYFSFYQILKDMQEFDYETPDYYKISDIQYNSGNGINISYMDYVVQNENNSEISLKENGTYKIKITSILNNSSKTFEITIDNIAPTISLIGCEIDGTTKEDVIIQGYSVGDTVYIYKDGKLVSRTYISSKSVTPPTIKDGGKYEVVVESEAGVKSSVKFIKDYIANTAGSVLIIILIFATVICLFIGLILRNKLKVDN